MPTYKLTFEGTVRETYVVDAASEEEALTLWDSTEPESSEVIDGDIEKVEITNE